MKEDGLHFARKGTEGNENILPSTQTWREGVKGYLEEGGMTRVTLLIRDENK